MIWSILIATLARRDSKLEQLLTNLGRQLSLYQPMVEVVALRNHGQYPLSAVRQSLVQDARGQYLSFVDDDDRLPDYYVSTILPLLDGVDYVGWRMQALRDGYELKPTYHTLDSDGWWESDVAFYRDVSHLNPVRTNLARQCDFRRGDPPEDVSWADQMRPLVNTQNLCDGDRIMYYYEASQHDSSWQFGHEPPWDGATDPLQPDRFDHIPGFRWHPDST